MNTKHPLHQLVDSKWLQLNSHSSSVHIVEITSAYNKSTCDLHLKNSLFLDMARLEGGPMWNVFNRDIIIQNLLQLFPKEKLVSLVSNSLVLLGDDLSCVYRAAIILMNLGFNHVCVVDGGKSALIKSDMSLEKASVCNHPSKYTEDSLIHYNNEDIEDIKSHLTPLDLIKNHSFIKDMDYNYYTLISIRSIEEFNGLTSGYSYISKKGHIPNSIHGGDIGLYRQADGTMIEKSKLIELLKLNKGKSKIFYCGTGWRASEVLFYVYTLGFDCYLYDGGWYEWSSTESI